MATSLTVNKSQTTGGNVPADVFGSAVGDAGVNFSFMATPSWQAAAKSLDLPLVRTNSTMIKAVFANGLNNPNWTALDNVVNNLHTWFDGKLILSLGSPPSGVSTTTYGQMVTATIQHMAAAGVTPYGIETYNEPDGSVSATTVGQYTLAAAKAAQAVNPGIHIFAGVTSWDNASYLNPVLSALGNTPNVVVDYHAYSSGDTSTSDTTLMGKALSMYAQDVQDVHKNVSASDPQLIGEYNMSYDWQPTDPRQATAEGAVNAALSMSTAANAGLQMGAIWELYNDQTFGIISDTSGKDVIRPDGYVLSELAKVMPGQIVSSSLGSGASNLYTLSTTGGTEIVNYGTSGDQTVNVTGLGSGVSEWIMDAANPAGTTIASPNLSALDIPAMSVVVLSSGTSTSGGGTGGGSTNPPSPNDTVVTAASGGSIVDGGGNAWTISSGAVQENGQPAGYSANVAEIATVSGTIWQENTSNLWWSWNGTGWDGGNGISQSPLPATTPTPPPPPPAPTPSPDDTVVTASSGGSIIDQSGNAWTLNGGVVYENAQAAGLSANVSEIATVSGTIWQEAPISGVNNWWSWNSSASSWGGQTTISPLPSGGSITPPPPTGNGDTFVLNNGNTASVTLGAGDRQINFTGGGSVSLTSGSGQSTIADDAGNNTFVAGSGSLNVTGGSGADAYVYHADSGLLTVEDFSLAKGDTLTIDASLQGSLHQASDGKGGTMLSFADASHGVDIPTMTSMSSSDIHWA